MSTALLIVDVQHDFLPGGALAVPDGDAVLDALEAAAPTVDLIVASRDAHPADHSSFAAQGGIWPPHCVEGNHGAEWWTRRPSATATRTPRSTAPGWPTRSGRAASTASSSAGSRPTTASARRSSMRSARALR